MASSNALKRLLSESSYGKGVKIVATATAGTLVHTAVNSTTPGTYDEIWLYAMNNHTASVNITIERGSADAEQNIVFSIASKTGLWLDIPGLCLQNALTVKVFASVANVVTIHGYVNAITD